MLFPVTPTIASAYIASPSNRIDSASPLPHPPPDARNSEISPPRIFTRAEPPEDLAAPGASRGPRPEAGRRARRPRRGQARGRVCTRGVLCAARRVWPAPRGRTPGPVAPCAFRSRPGPRRLRGGPIDRGGCAPYQGVRRAGARPLGRRHAAPRVEHSRRSARPRTRARPPGPRARFSGRARAARPAPDDTRPTAPRRRSRPDRGVDAKRRSALSVDRGAAGRLFAWRYRADAGGGWRDVVGDFWEENELACLFCVFIRKVRCACNCECRCGRR